MNRKLTAAAGAAIAAMLCASPALRAADSPGMVTWSISGSTAMRNFTIGAGFSALEAGASNLTLSNGVYAPGVSGLQFAPSPFTGANLAGSTGPGVRIEWHEQGSVEGILELANDQIGYVGGIGGTPLVNPTERVPTSGNRIFINRGTFSGGGTQNGYTISGSPVYNTYDPANYNVSGNNLLGGQNRVQMAISDVNAAQGFSRVGGAKPAPNTPVFALNPTNANYGKGNTLLPSSSVSGLGSPGGRQQLFDQSVLNMSTDKINPQTGANYAAGEWNTAGVDNLVNKTVAITATVIAANPGTGLTQINRGDAQWLQVAGRFENGLDFNVAQRDVNSGTRNVFALNAGVDPSWAAGENDNGNGNPGNPIGSADSQASIGENMRFSGKTAGGAQLRPTVQNNRMAIGPLGLSDARSGSAASSNATAFPIRALQYSDTQTDAGANFVQVSAASITDGSYKFWQNQTYVTVRTPDANYGNEDILKGDANGDVTKLRNNILNSVTNFPNPTSVNNAADQLLSTSFILPQMMVVEKTFDGGEYTDVSSQVVNGQTRAQWRDDLLSNPPASNFNVIDPALQTDGNNAFYGVSPISSGNSTLGVGVASILITAQDSSGVATNSAAAPKGNYLFGNFNQTGVRDFDAVKKAQAAQAALAAVGAGADDALDPAVSNNAKVTGISAALDSMNNGTGPSKGDLIVLGDFNGDGKFNGRDLYLMSRGVAVSDSQSTSASNFNGGTLGATSASFGEAVRGGQLRKNAALDYMDATATAQQRIDASADIAADPTGALAFSKVEVNRDGVLDLKDAKIVDFFAGQSYRNLSQQAIAVIGTDGDSALYTQSVDRKPISLVDVELTDSADGAIDTFDFRPVRVALGTLLKDGDTDFNGVINFDDYGRTDTGFLSQNNPGFVQAWSRGDFDSNGVVNFDDYALIDAAFLSQRPGAIERAVQWLNGGADGADLPPDLQVVGTHYQQFGEPYASGLLAAVPEPASAGMLSALSAFGLRRRRRRD